MKHTHQNPVVAGVGTAMGAVLFAGLLLSCQPGKLPCDDPAWKEVCESDGGPVVVAGNGGNSGGQGGNSGGQGGGGGGVTAATTIDCSAYPTLGDMDKFFAMRCGAASNCHTMPMPWTDMRTAGIFERLKNQPTQFACKPAKLIDGTTWTNSMIWVKTKGMPTCP